MTDNHDECQYNKCHAPLGEWQPHRVNVDGFIDGEIRTCEKCGGSQYRATMIDSKLIDACNTILEAKRPSGGDEHE